ncbi:TRAP transporter solute receptor [Stanieria sp. NIES-3757]|nr:TRAP transporter solute receptor [Stanieria sp. NIES-3757]
MKRFLYFCLSLGLILILNIIPTTRAKANVSNSVELNILTASERGTYYAIAEDLEKLVSQSAIDLDVIPSDGALKNVYELYNHPSIPLALSQLDILAFMNTMANDDEDMRQQFEALRLVLPLYQEEVHLLAHDEIKSIADLNNKKVAIGAEGSGTSITAVMMLQNARVAPQQLLQLEPLRAIDALRKREIDALFYVVGIPDRAFVEEISAEDRLKLVPVQIESVPNDEFFSKIYSNTTIPAQTYSWQAEPVETVAVQSALFTTDSENCQEVGKFARLIYENLDWLKQNGHPKWQSIEFDLNDIKADPRLSTCVAQELTS